MTEPRITHLDPLPFGDDPLEEHVAAREVVHRGRYLEFRVDTIVRADGTSGTRDVVGHPGAIAVLAVDDDGRLLLVRQWRIPAERGDARDPGRNPRRPRRRHRGPRPRRATGAGGGDRPAGGDLAQALHVLDRARVRDRADAPVPRHGYLGRRRDGPPHPRRGRAPGAQPRGDRRRRRHGRSAARSATRRRSSASSGWTASREPARSERARPTGAERRRAERRLCGLRARRDPRGAGVAPAPPGTSRSSVESATARRRCVHASRGRPRRLRLRPSA